MRIKEDANGLGKMEVIGGFLRCNYFGVKGQKPVWCGFK